MTELWLIIWGVSFIRFFSGFFDAKLHNELAPKSSFTIALDILFSLGILFLITSNVTGNDIVNYASKFNYNFDDSIRERFFYLLRVTAYQYNINFFTFRTILQFVASLFLLHIFRICKISFAGFLLFYMPILLFMDSMQFRNSICIWILAFAIGLLTDSKKNRQFLCLIIIILIAQIHSAFIFYILFLLYPFFEKYKRFYRFFYTFIIFFSFIVILNGNKIPYLDIILKYVLDSSDTRISLYSTTARWGFIIPTFIQIILLYIMSVGYKILRFCEFDNLECKNVTYYSIVLFLNKISLLFVPFMMMNITYYRFLRNGYFLAIIAIIGIINLIPEKVNKIYLLLSLSVVTVLWVMFEVVVYDTPENIIYPILKEGMPFFYSNKYFK